MGFNNSSINVLNPLGEVESATLKLFYVDHSNKLKATKKEF